MNLNKSELYKQVAQETDIKKDVIDKIFKATEHIVFDFLANVDENEIRKVFLMNGICAESEIIHTQERSIPNGNAYPEERISMQKSQKDIRKRLIRTDKLSKYQFVLCTNAHAVCS